MDHELQDELKTRKPIGWGTNQTGTCDCCNMKTEVIRYQYDGGEDPVIIDIFLCNPCALPVLDPSALPPTIRQFRNASLLKAVDALHREWRAENPIVEVPAGDDDAFMDELSVKHGEFVKCMEEFTAGHFTLDNGREDEMLASITSQVMDDEKFPSEKQVSAYRFRCDHYIVCRRTGEPLIEPITLRRSGAEVSSVMSFLLKSVKSLGEREQEAVTSMSKFYKTKGYLTEKQLNYLKKIKRGVDF